MIRNAKVNTESINCYKVKIYPTDEQIKRINRLIDLSRYVYNWALGQRNKYYKETGKSLKMYDMFQRFKELRNSSEKEWLKEIPLATARHSIMNLYNSLELFFKKKRGYPKFRAKKFDRRKSFHVRGSKVWINDNGLSLEGMGHNNRISIGNCDIIPMRSRNNEYNPNYYNCTISFDGNNYWFSTTVQVVRPIQFEGYTDVIGIDVGLRKMAVLSDGTIYKIPKIAKKQKRLALLRNKLLKSYRKRRKESSRVKTKLSNILESSNLQKARNRFARYSKYLTNMKHTYIHQMTRDIVNRHPKAIVMEGLDISKLLRHVGKFTRDQLLFNSFYEIRHCLEYKCKQEGIDLYFADKEYPSSQICSNCGYRHKSIGSREIYVCPNCEFTIDRDLNAAINLRNLVAY